MRHPRGSRRGTRARISWTPCPVCRKAWSDPGTHLVPRPCPWCGSRDFEARSKMKAKEKTSICRTATAARDKERTWATLLATDGVIDKDPEDLGRTFAALTALCHEKVFIAPVLKGEVKIKGQYSWEDSRQRSMILCDLLGPKDVADITPADCEAVRVELHERKARHWNGRESVETDRTLDIHTVNRILQVLRRMLFIAIDEGWIRKSPFRKTLIQKGGRVRERALTPDEKARLLASCQRPSPQGFVQVGRKRLYAMVLIALETGMRLGEIQQLQWADIRDQVIVLPSLKTKAKKQRMVPVTDKVRGVLDEARKEVPNSKPEDRVFGKGSISSAWRSALKASGINLGPGERIVFHSLRHTASTDMHESGANAEDIRYVLGHGDREMNERYTHRRVASVAKVAALLNKRRGVKSRLAAAKAVFEQEKVN